MIRACIFTIVVALAPSAASAQARWFKPTAGAPAISIRPFLDVRTEKFFAVKTFDAIFGETTAPFWGGGLQVTGWRGRVYGEVGASRLMKKRAQLVGERVFLTDGNVFKLGIPLRSTIKPVEATFGYRFNVHRRVVPYIGGGVGSYHYTEQSDFADEAENVDVTHRGGIFQTGVELRAHRWIGVAIDAQYTRVPGILGNGGISQQLADDTASTNSKRERDLGGWAARLKIVVGR